MRKIQTISIWFVKSSILFYAASPVTAQIVPDATLPTNSNVTLEGNEAVITEGTQAGSNLFHSFEQFSVPTGGTAYFNNALDIQNIFSRVTGSPASSIDGLLRANGTANLFLLNPNGIIFGPNASLNIGGSFVASTANSLNFADNTQFSANSPQSTPLLTISVPIGLGFGSNSRQILVQGSGAVRNPNSGLLLNREAGLSVQPSSTLALVGNGIALEGGILSSEGGRLELGSVTDSSLVRITPIDKGWALDYSDAQNFENIQLSQEATVDASGLGGNVQVRGRQIALTNGSQIEISTIGSEPGGTLSVNASESVELIGRSANNQFPSAIGATLYPQAIGNGGNITIETGRLSLRDGAQMGAVTAGIGTAGNLTIKTKESVDLVGTSLDGRFPTSLSTSSRPGATGNGGNLSVETGRFSVLNGAQIQASTFGTGAAGNLTVKAKESVDLVGTTADGRFPTAITTSATRGATGKGGNLTIETGRLSIRDGAQMGSVTAGIGTAGNLTIKAKESVELIGTTADGQRPSALSTRTTNVGDAGNLGIKTEYLTIRNGASVTVSSEGSTSGKAGQLEVQASSIYLDNQAKLVAETFSGEGGDIVLQVQNLLLLRRNSQISTEARGTANGGNIIINSPFIVAMPKEDNDIIANAIEGRGGNISIRTQGIFGIQPRNQNTLQSDITASSQLGINGTVQIDTPDFEPSQGLVSLSKTLVDVSRLVAQGCSESRSNVGEGKSEFIITGRGGLPLQPGESLQAETIVVNNDTLEAAKEQRSALVNTVPQDQATSTQLVEAQGWIIDDQGEVVLTTQPPTATPDNSASTQATCYAP